MLCLLDWRNPSNGRSLDRGITIQCVFIVLDFWLVTVFAAPESGCDKARTCLFYNCKQSVGASSMTSNLLNSIDLGQRLNKPLVLSSRQLSWNGVLVEQFQRSSTSSFEMELPAISDHWLNISLGQPAHLTQKHGDRMHESIV
jgi:hypothetical protein